MGMVSPFCLYWLLFLPLGGLMVALALLGPLVVRRLAVERQCLAMQAEVDALNETVARLAAAEHALKNDPAYTERIVRHDLGITRPGEIRLPQPVSLSARHMEAARAPAPALPAPARALVSLAEGMTDPVARLAVLAAGSMLLAAGVLFSLPPPEANAKPARGY